MKGDGDRRRRGGPFLPLSQSGGKPGLDHNVEYTYRKVYDNTNDDSGPPVRGGVDDPLL